MADYIQTMADKELERLSKEIARTYAQAAREINQKLKGFIDGFKARDAQMKASLAKGDITEQDYKDWLRGQVFQGDQWKAKLDQITKAYQQADEKARQMVGKADKTIFANAANYQAFEAERNMYGGVSFSLYDQATVDRLIRDNPKMLPEWKIDEPKDYVWNEKQVQNAVAQGIIQGESVYDIGKRLTEELAASNASKMDMFARTAVTGAQNAGRIERMHEAEEMGIRVKKRWLACHDTRVRDTHAELDGQEVDVDEPFVVDGMEIGYPGDPTAPPELTYNCRCTLLYVYPEYKDKQGFDEHQTYKEWLEEKQEQEKQEREKEKQSFKKPEENDKLEEEEPSFQIDNYQFGKKAGKHSQEFGLDVTKPEDRQRMMNIIQDIFENAEEVCSGDWRGQEEGVLFFIKGDDVVVTLHDGTFITILKGGVNNARVKKARRR